MKKLKPVDITSIFGLTIYNYRYYKQDWKVMLDQAERGVIYQCINGIATFSGERFVDSTWGR